MHKEQALSIYFTRTYQRGFGTWPLRGAALRDSVLSAVEAGYRAFDTAQMYQNEAEVGSALAECGIPRNQICITSKVPIERFSVDQFLPSVERSLCDLRVDFLDVLLLHWPPADGVVEPAVDLLVDARNRGLARNIGVSNFNSRMMRDAKRVAGPNLCTNQVEFHPLLNQQALLAAATEMGIPLSSYCSVARGEVFRHPDFEEIGRKYGKSAAQVVLRWILQKGVSVNTMSTNPANIKANFEVMDFTLSSIDMARIDALNQTDYRIVTSQIVPWAPDWD